MAIIWISIDSYFSHKQIFNILILIYIWTFCMWFLHLVTALRGVTLALPIISEESSWEIFFSILYKLAGYCDLLPAEDRVHEDLLGEPEGINLKPPKEIKSFTVWLMDGNNHTHSCSTIISAVIISACKIGLKYQAIIKKKYIYIHNI